MATVLARLKSWSISSISMPSCATQPPAIRAVADLLELLMEATTQLSEALEQFSGEERRNTLQSRIREHEWDMEKRQLLKERGALREQLELQKSLHTLAEEKLHRVQAASTPPAASTATTPQRTTSPSWLPILPPVISVSSIPITLPELSPKGTDTAPSHEIKEIKMPSRPATIELECTESPTQVTSLQPITNLPIPPTSLIGVVSRRRVRPATPPESATCVTDNDITGTAQAATLVASTGENPTRSRTVLRGPRAPCASTFPPPRNLPVGPTPKTHTGTNTDTNTNTAHPLTPSRVQSDREAALQTLTSAVALLSSRHSVQPASNQRLWLPKSGSSHPPSSMLNLVGAPPRRESLPTVTQRTATLVPSAPQSQSHPQSQSVMNHIRPPRAQRPTSPPPSFPPRRTDLRRSSREIVI
jgi:hypothetical protein